MTDSNIDSRYMDIEHLTSEQEELLDSFSDTGFNDEVFPDNWDRDFQRDILSMLLSDRYFLIQSIDMIQPSFFVDHVHKNLCKFLFSYFRQYGEIPRKTYVQHEIETTVDGADRQAAHFAELNVLVDLYQPGLANRDYLTDKIYNFAQTQQFKIAVGESVDLLKSYGTEEDAWNKVKDKVRTALLFEKNFDQGLDYFKTFRERYERMMSDEERKDRFITGIDTVDQNIKGGGLSRGELGAVIAPSGVGKSLFLANCAVRNYLRGKRVLYLSLEMKQDKVAERIDAMLTKMPISELYHKKEEVFHRIDKSILDKKDMWRLVIKEFPASSADINTFRAYASQLTLRGFVPDLVIVDYVGEMKDYTGIKVYESREKLVRDLRRFASEENVCVMTALQPNRSGKAASKESYIDEEHFGDSQGQIRPMDACWSLNQNDIEEKAGLLRLFCIKHRDGKSRFWAYVKKDHKNLTFTEVDRKTYSDLASEQKNREAIMSSDKLGAAEFDPATLEIGKETVIGSKMQTSIGENDDA